MNKLIGFVAFVIILFLAKNYIKTLNDKLLSPIVTIPQVVKKKQAPIVAFKGITLRADNQGHFRGIALINNVSMPFMIDTGATKTSIPEKMAIAAGLPLGNTVQTNTAGGQVTDRLTQIRSLKIGNAEINNLDANSNKYLNEVLIGMNTLQYFQITKNENTLTLVSNSPVVKLANQFVPVITREQTVIKKTVFKKILPCVAGKGCRTIYSDQPIP